MLRCNGGVRLAVRLYLRGFCETAERAIWLEPGSRLARLRARRCHLGRSFSAAGAVDRSIWSSPDHSSLHDGVLRRDYFVGIFTFPVVAILRDLYLAGLSWQRCRSSCLFAFHFFLVSATFGNGAGFRHGGSGVGCLDPARHCASYHQQVWLEGSLLFSRLPCLAARPATELAL